MTVLYSKSLWGLPLLLRIYGSALPRALPAVAITAVYTALLSCYAGADVRAAWAHPFAFNSFAIICAFLLVFRSNQGYSRYWEGRTNLQAMTSRLRNTASHALLWDRWTLPEPLDAASEAAARRFSQRVTHLLSLLHACACQALRRDPSLDNLKPHRSGARTPPMDPAILRARRLRHTASSFAASSTSGAPPVDLQYVGRSSVKDVFLLRGTPANIERYNAAQKLPVIQVPSAAESAALACPPLDAPASVAAGGCWAGDALGHCSLLPWSIESEERLQRSTNARCCTRHLPFMERPWLVQAWLQTALVARMREGGLNLPAPITQRIFQELNEAMLAYEQCRKLADTPFPFPFAQLIVLLLVGFAATLPVVVVAYVPSPPLAVVISAVSVLTYVAVNEVARDIEDPFLYEPNEIALAAHQHAFNEVLLSVAATCWPAASPTPPGERQDGGPAALDHPTPAVGEATAAWPSCWAQDGAGLAAPVANGDAAVCKARAGEGGSAGCGGVVAPSRGSWGDDAATLPDRGEDGVVGAGSAAAPADTQAPSLHRRPQQPAPDQVFSNDAASRV